MPAYAPFGFQPHVLRDETQRADLATRANVDVVVDNAPEFNRHVPSQTNAAGL
jgi:hypothetical protein